MLRLHTVLHVVACCWELLYPFEHHCNKDVTTRKIVGATMLGVVASGWEFIYGLVLHTNEVFFINQYTGYHLSSFILTHTLKFASTI